MIIGEYGPFVYLTYFGTAMAILAMQASLQGQPKLSMIYFIICGLCDLFDGQVARALKRTPAQEQFGVEIDSLCDMINFAALPAVILLTQSYYTHLASFVAIVYVLAAVSRLAFFNRQAKSSEERPSHFRGLPVTYAALVFPISYLVCQWIDLASFAFLLPVLGTVLAFLFVWDIPIPKPQKRAYIFFLLLALATLIGLWRL